jgi:hypothetical protein
LGAILQAILPAEFSVLLPPVFSRLMTWNTNRSAWVIYFIASNLPPKAKLYSTTCCLCRRLVIWNETAPIQE